MTFKNLPLFFLLLAACTPEITQLSPQQAQELIHEKEDLFVLNVHTPYEGKIEGTDAIIEDWENIAAHINQLPTNKNTPLLVYCRTGRMSTSAANQLQTLGYNNIYHLEGGMKAWHATGQPLIEKTFE